MDIILNSGICSFCCLHTRHEPRRRLHRTASSALGKKKGGRTPFWRLQQRGGGLLAASPWTRPPAAGREQTSMTCGQFLSHMQLPHAARAACIPPHARHYARAHRPRFTHAAARLPVPAPVFSLALLSFMWHGTFIRKVWTSRFFLTHGWYGPRTHARFCTHARARRSHGPVVRLGGMVKHTTPANFPIV